MTLLIINLDKFIGNAQAWRDVFREQLPDLPIRIWPAAIGVGFLATVSYRRPPHATCPRKSCHMPVTRRHDRDCNSRRRRPYGCGRKRKEKR